MNKQDDVDGRQVAVWNVLAPRPDLRGQASHETVRILFLADDNIFLQFYFIYY